MRTTKPALILAAGAVLAITGQTLARQHEGHNMSPAIQPPTTTTPAPHMQGMEACKEMMARHQKVMTDLQAAADAKLEPLVSKMNAARGEARLDAAVAVLNEVIAQRKEMHAHTLAMPMQCPMMMGPGGAMH
jgi:hypothetical protein